MKRVNHLIILLFFLKFSLTVKAQTPGQGGVIIYTLARTKWDQYTGNPIIEPGASGWNVGMVLGPTVIIFKDTLRMWYTGGPTKGFGGKIQIGYAWSLDGITWQQYSENPVFSPRKDEWDYPEVLKPIVIADGDTLRMWYGGGTIYLGDAKNNEVMRIGYATSVDGINWNRNPEPVIEPPPPPHSSTANPDVRPLWDQDGVLPGGVIKEDGVFKMWFSGGVGRYAYPSSSSYWSIGYATSSDCIHWNLLPDPVLLHGKITDFDEMADDAYVIRTNAGYDMWYGGHSKEAVKANKPQAKIGYASSTDGIHWIKYDKNPVLSPTSVSPQWTTGYYTPSVLFDGEQFQMWFTGWSEGNGTIAIGYATSALDTINFTRVEVNLLTQESIEYKLFQNYPNPFNPTTSISYSLPNDGFVTLSVYDILGRQVAALENGYKKAGNYDAFFDANKLNSGIYIYTLKVGSFSEAKKMLLIK